MSFVSFIDTTKLRIKFGLTAILLIGFIYCLIEIIYYKTKSTYLCLSTNNPRLHRTVTHRNHSGTAQIEKTKSLQSFSLFYLLLHPLSIGISKYW